MKRREFIILLGTAAVTWPFGAHAQQQATKMPRIGLLSPFSPSDTAAWHQAFLYGLEELGWSDGKNIYTEEIRRGCPALGMRWRTVQSPEGMHSTCR